MRKIGLFVASAVIIMTCVALVEGQPEEKKKGGGGGGFFQQRPQNPLSLLNSKAVKTELDLTDEQVEKLPAEVLAAISKVLNEKQFKRFKQIELQSRGTNALKDATVQKQLKLSGEQKTSITDIIEASNKELAELFKGGGFGKGGGEKIATARKEAKEKVLAVLTTAQRTAWDEMLGAEFKFQQGGGGKKKDTPKENK